MLAVLATTSALAAGHGEPGPVYPVEIRLVDRHADLDLLTEMRIDVDAVFRDRVRAYLVAEEEDKLTLLGFDVARIPDEAKIAAEREATEGIAPDAAAYHTYATLTSALQQVVQDHPSIARLESAGKSVQGRELWILKVSKNPDVAEDEPAVRYIAAMHGDEVVGKENCINFIDLLTDGYGADARVTALVDSAEIWILPSANPDGTELHQRYNAAGYDLNRDFPDQFEDPVDSTAGRQIETADIMNWGYAHSVILSGNFHGGAVVANYPWDGTASHSSVYNASPDDPLFVSIARTYADHYPLMLASNADPSYDNGICNGADWYVIYGGMQDWNYLWHGANDITLEITNAKWPAATQLPAIWNGNQESMLSYLERVHEGIRGVVTDAVTGAPLAATVRVDGIDHSGYTDPARGDYHRMLLPGSYAIEVSAAGYSTSLVSGIDVVAGGPATRRDVALRPLDVNLQPVFYRILDGAGGNGQLDPGEAADLPVTLRDLGLAATGVAGRLIPTGWHGAVTRAEAFYPDLPAGGRGETLSPHHGVALSSSTPSGHKAGFAIEWTSDQGSGTSDTFFVDTGTASCSTVASSDVPKAILDRQAAASALSFAADLEISEMNVYVDATHPYVGDLTVTVISPAGTPVVLHDRTGGSTDNIVVWYDRDRAPTEPLARVAGEHSAGTWTLKVNDGVPQNTGTLNQWSLEVCGRPFEGSTPEMRFREMRREESKTVLSWWPYPGTTSYRVYRSTMATGRADFADVTSQDPNTADTVFEDVSSAPVLYWLVTGVGAAGEGPR
jgi:carboxypeptidase D